MSAARLAVQVVAMTLAALTSAPAVSRETLVRDPAAYKVAAKTLQLGETLIFTDGVRRDSPGCWSQTV